MATSALYAIFSFAFDAETSLSVTSVTGEPTQREQAWPPS